MSQVFYTSLYGSSQGDHIPAKVRGFGKFGFASCIHPRRMLSYGEEIGLGFKRWKSFAFE